MNQANGGHSSSMDRTLGFILSLSILIPLVIGMIRYRQLPASYLPLIYVLFTGLLTEVISYFFFYKTTNAIPSNIYNLAEFLLISWQFRRWKNILRNNLLYTGLIAGMTLGWFIEMLLLHQINEFSTVSQVAFAIALILLAVNQMNWLIVNEKSNILFNSVFLLCIAIMIFFSYKVLMEIFYYYAPERMIKNNIFIMQSYINVGYNIILAVAILCIPTKKNFIQPSR